MIDATGEDPNDNLTNLVKDSIKNVKIHESKVA